MGRPKKTQLLVHINGFDQIGVTAAITKYFGEKGYRILDIEQTVVLSHLSLHILIEGDDVAKDNSEAMLNEILKEFNLNILTREVDEELELPDPADRFVVTIIANDVAPKFIADITSSIADHKANIDSIRKLNNGGLETIELVFSSQETISLSELTEELLNISSTYDSVDLAVQRENLYRRSKRLIVFDMDSTLLQGEVIDELGSKAGKREEMAAITQSAMEGKIDFAQSLRDRVKLLTGITKQDMSDVADSLKLTPGAKTLIKVLKKLGYRIAVFSGGFMYFAEKLKEDLGLHYVCANRLEFENGTCTGKLDGVIVDAERKADLLELLAQQENILLEQVIAVGDGANDLLMLQKAGLGIAFNAKPITRAKADTSLNKKSMTSLLYLLGITDNEIKEMGFSISSLRSQQEL